MHFWDKIANFAKENQNLAKIGVGDILGTGVATFFWFYIAAAMGPENYGELQYFLGIAGMAQIFSLFATSQVLTVYTAKNVKIQSTLIFISLILGAISILITMALFSKFDVSFLIIAFMLPEIANGIILGKKCFSKYSKLLLLQKFLLFSLGISFYHMFGFESVLIAMALSYLPYTKIIYTEMKTTKINIPLLQEKKGFVFNNYIIMISSAVNGQIDKLIIAPLLGFALLGEYALILQIISGLTILSTIIYKYILPQDSSGEITTKLKKISILMSIVIAFLGMTLLPLIIPHLFPKFENVIDGIRYASFVVIPITISMLHISKLLGSEKSRFVLISNVISTVIFFVGFMTLGPLFGIVGLVTVLLVSSSIQALIVVIATKFIEKTQT